MEDDGFTTVRRSGRGRGSRHPRVPLNKKTSLKISYTSQASSRPRNGDATVEQRLQKVLAILETRRRQLVEEEGHSGKGKERSFVASWTGKHMFSVNRATADHSTMDFTLRVGLLPDQLAAIRSILRDPNDERETEPRFTRISCLGIGITSESRESQFQFVLLDLLKEAFEVSVPGRGKTKG